MVPVKPTTSFLSMPSSSGLIKLSSTSQGSHSSPNLNCRASYTPAVSSALTYFQQRALEDKKTHLGTRRTPDLGPLLGLTGDILSLVARDAAPLLHHLGEGPLLERDIGVLAEALGRAGDGLADPDARVDGHVAGKEDLGLRVRGDDLDVLAGAGLKRSQHSLHNLKLLTHTAQGQGLLTTSNGLRKGKKAMFCG